MNQKNFIILGIPRGVEPDGVRCLSISEQKIYEQMQRPRGSDWRAVESGVVITGQRLVDFLFQSRGSTPVDITGSDLEVTGGADMKRIMGHITCY